MGGEGVGQGMRKYGNGHGGDGMSRGREGKGLIGHRWGSKGDGENNEWGLDV